MAPAPDAIRDTNVAPASDAIRDTNIAPASDAIRDTNAAPTYDVIRDTNVAPTSDAKRDTNVAPTPESIRDTKVASASNAIRDTSMAATPDAIRDTNVASASNAIRDTNVAVASKIIRDLEKKERTSNSSGYNYSDLKGNGKKIIDEILRECLFLRALSTNFIEKKLFSKEIGVKEGAIKTTIWRLRDKGIIEDFQATKGRNSSWKFYISQKIYDDFFVKYKGKS